MNFAIEAPERRILVWLIWVVALVVYRQPVQEPSYQIDQSVPLLGVMSYEQRRGWLFPWQPQSRWKKLALEHYRAWQRAYRQANRTAKLARLALRGALSLAQVIEGLTLAASALSVRGLAGVVCLVGDAPGAPDHQPPLSGPSRD